MPTIAEREKNTRYKDFRNARASCTSPPCNPSTGLGAPRRERLRRPEVIRVLGRALRAEKDWGGRRCAAEEWGVAAAEHGWPPSLGKSTHMAGGRAIRLIVSGFFSSLRSYSMLRKSRGIRAELRKHMRRSKQVGPRLHRTPTYTPSASQSAAGHCSNRPSGRQHRRCPAAARWNVFKESWLDHRRHSTMSCLHSMKTAAAARSTSSKS